MVSPTFFYQEKYFLNKFCLDKWLKPLGLFYFCEHRLQAKFQIAIVYVEVGFLKRYLILVHRQTYTLNLNEVVALAPLEIKSS